MKCPICRKEVEPGSPHAPFCTDRCRLIDLGNWASEKYRISTAVEPRQEAEDGQDERDE